MIARWEKGRAQVDRLLSENRLQQVRASRPLAEQMLEQAEAHVASATQLVGSDPAGAFQLAYDAARKSLRRSWPTRACGPKAPAHTPRCTRRPGRSCTHRSGRSSTRSTGCDACATAPSTQTWTAR